MGCITPFIIQWGLILVLFLHSLCLKPLMYLPVKQNLPEAPRYTVQSSRSHIFALIILVQQTSVHVSVTRWQDVQRFRRTSSLSSYSIKDEHLFHSNLWLVTRGRARGVLRVNSPNHLEDSKTTKGFKNLFRVTWLRTVEQQSRIQVCILSQCKELSKFLCMWVGEVWLKYSSRTISEVSCKFWLHQEDVVVWLSDLG